MLKCPNELYTFFEFFVVISTVLKVNRIIRQTTNMLLDVKSRRYFQRRCQDNITYFAYWQFTFIRLMYFDSRKPPKYTITVIA